MTRVLTSAALILLLVPACKEHSTTNNENTASSTEYKIIQGACGTVVYWEKLGSDFQTAFHELERRKIEQYSRYCPDAPCYEITLESYKIDVADENNVTPTEEFFAIRVLDKNTNMLVQSVSDAITSNGNLYKISWCPD